MYGTSSSSTAEVPVAEVQHTPSDVEAGLAGGATASTGDVTQLETPMNMSDTSTPAPSMYVHPSADNSNYMMNMSYHGSSAFAPSSYAAQNPAFTPSPYVAQPQTYSNANSYGYGYAYNGGNYNVNGGNYNVNGAYDANSNNCGGVYGGGYGATAAGGQCASSSTEYENLQEFLRQKHKQKEEEREKSESCQKACVVTVIVLLVVLRLAGMCVHSAAIASASRSNDAPSSSSKDPYSASPYSASASSSYTSPYGYHAQQSSSDKRIEREGYEFALRVQRAAFGLDSALSGQSSRSFRKSISQTQSQTSHSQTSPSQSAVDVPVPVTAECADCRFVIFEEVGALGKGGCGEVKRYGEARAVREVPAGWNNRWTSETIVEVDPAEARQMVAKGTEIAVKTMLADAPDTSSSSIGAELLRIEAQVHERLCSDSDGHPAVRNIPRFLGFDDGAEGVRPLRNMMLKMELIPGAVSLQQVRYGRGTDFDNAVAAGSIDRAVHMMVTDQVGVRPPPPGLAPGEASIHAVARLAHDVLVALSGMHAKGLVWRDLHRGNVLVHAKGQGQLTESDVSAGRFNAMAIDFGLMTEEGSESKDMSGITSMRAPEEFGRSCHGRDDEPEVLLGPFIDEDGDRAMLKMKASEYMANVYPASHMLNHPQIRESAIKYLRMLDACDKSDELRASSSTASATSEGRERILVNPKSDVYSLGVLLFDTLCRGHTGDAGDGEITPYAETDTTVLAHNLGEDVHEFKLFAFNRADALQQRMRACAAHLGPRSEPLLAIVRSMLAANLHERWSSQQALDSLRDQIQLPGTSW